MLRTWQPRKDTVDSFAFFLAVVDAKATFFISVGHFSSPRVNQYRRRRFFLVLVKWTFEIGRPTITTSPPLPFALARRVTMYDLLNKRYQSSLHLPQIQEVSRITSTYDIRTYAALYVVMASRFQTSIDPRSASRMSHLRCLNPQWTKL